MSNLTDHIKMYARSIGFDAVGVTSAEPFSADGDVTRERIAAGHYSGLAWFTPERARFSIDPHNLLPTAKSIISLAMSYRPRPDRQPRGSSNHASSPRGRVSAYAWGLDYHRVLKDRMDLVVRYIGEMSEERQPVRTLVDTARILDRAAARRAGVGWVGKHTNVITKEAGSWVFLGEILTELELQPDRPLKTNCGTCELCLRVCPTGAIVAPYTIDNNRCISYLTIEHRGVIPRDLRPLMGDWVFGCDACKEVCPPNLRAGASADPAFRPIEDKELEATGHPELIPLLEITQVEFTRRFSRTPVKRAHREGLQRNAAVALGNSGDRSAVPALAKALREATPIVRGHAAWALGRLGGAQALAALRDSMSTEQDHDVRGEIAAALAECTLDRASGDHV